MIMPASLSSGTLCLQEWKRGSDIFAKKYLEHYTKFSQHLFILKMASWSLFFTATDRKKCAGKFSWSLINEYNSLLKAEWRNICWIAEKIFYWTFWCWSLKTGTGVVQVFTGSRVYTFNSWTFEQWTLNYNNENNAQEEYGCAFYSHRHDVQMKMDEHSANWARRKFECALIAKLTRQLRWAVF